MVLLGVRHLLIGDELVRLLKRPFCNFQNIHEQTITYHIRHTKDSRHNVNLDELDKSRYIVTRIPNSPNGPYVGNADIPVPWVKCLWCDYRDKIDFDLSLHFLEQHKRKLLAIPITDRDRKAVKALSCDPFAIFEGPMEYRLDKAVKMAKDQGQGQVQGGIDHV